MPCCFHTVANIDFLVHLHKLVIQVLHLRLLDVLVGGLIKLQARLPQGGGPCLHMGGIDESAQLFCLSRSKRQFIHSFSGNLSVLNLGLHILVAFEFFSKIPDLHRLVIVSTSMNFLSSLVILSLLCSCKPSKIVSTKSICKRASDFLCIHEIIARTLRCVSPKRLSRSGPDGPVSPRLCSDLPTCIGHRTLRTTSYTRFSCSWRCRRARVRPTTCNFQAGIGGNEGTRTKV